jgi:hypothetical protein
VSVTYVIDLEAVKMDNASLQKYYFMMYLWCLPFLTICLYKMVILINLREPFQVTNIYGKFTIIKHSFVELKDDFKPYNNWEIF